LNGFIMAAGLGTRLDPFTRERPKPLFPAGSTTFLDRSALFVKGCGIEYAVVNAHHLAPMIDEHVKRNKGWGMDVAVVEEPRVLGTGGGARHAARHLPEGSLMIVAGDVAFDIDPAAFVAAHRSSGAAATIAVATRGDVNTYGGVWVTDDDRVTDIAGLLDRTEGRLIVNASAYIVDSALIDHLPGPGGCLVRDFLVPLLRDRVPISAYVHRGFWAESGTPDLLLEANLTLLDLEARQKPASNRRDRAASASAAGRAMGITEPVLVGSNVTVEEGVTLGPGVVVADGCRLGRGCTIRRSLLLPGTVVTGGEEIDYTVRSARHNWRRPSVENRS